MSVEGCCRGSLLRQHMNGSQLLRVKYATVRVKTQARLRQPRRLKWGWKSSIKYLAETDDIMTESESGGKLVNKLAKTGNGHGGRGAAVCQGWGSILLGAGIHGPNSWWDFASEWGWLLQSSSSSSQGPLVPPGHFPNQCGGQTSVHVQRCHSSHHLTLQPVCAQWVGSSGSSRSHLCTPDHSHCRGPGTLDLFFSYGIFFFTWTKDCLMVWLAWR